MRCARSMTVLWENTQKSDLFVKSNELTHLASRLIVGCHDKLPEALRPTHGR